MKKLICLTLALLLPLAALADPLVLTEPLAGVLCWPEGTDETTAAYVYMYSYPQVEASTELEAAVNEFYAYEVANAAAFTVPMAGESLSDPSVQSRTEITGEVTLNNDAYFSVLVTRRDRMDGGEAVIVSAQVFERESDKAGGVLTLPYLLGILAGGETDTWMQARQTAKADNCAREMVWAQIEAEREAGARPFFDDLTFELFGEVFYPEEDFYLNADGDVVFFIQPGTIAEESAGVLTYVVPLEELLDEI